MNIFDRVRALPPGTVIPKPAAHADFKIKGVGTRRGEPALIYSIPSHTGRSLQKGVTISEWQTAEEEIRRSGEITRDWFNRKLMACAKEGGCNFTTIGGVFELLGLARYSARGVYRSTGKQERAQSQQS